MESRFNKIYSNGINTTGKMKFSLKNKTVIVTGGASGIGKAIAQTFAKQGAFVHIVDLNTEDGKKVVEKLLKKSFKAKLHQCNVANQKEVTKVINCIAKNGKIDILINNAGIAHVGNIEETKEEDLDRLYNVNIKGVYNCIRACISTMKENKSGVILNITSIASTVAVANRFAYSMTKGAVLTMTYSVAKDYINFGIRCNSISPARIHTPFVDGFLTKNYPGKETEMFENLSKTQPIGRMGTPQEVADLALFLCSDEASFITGTEFPIDGGFIKLNG